jgi:hypothetical protein
VTSPQPAARLIDAEPSALWVPIGHTLLTCDVCEQPAGYILPADQRTACRAHATEAGEAMDLDTGDSERDLGCNRHVHPVFADLLGRFAARTAGDYRLDQGLQGAEPYAAPMKGKDAA